MNHDIGQRTQQRPIESAKSSLNHQTSGFTPENIVSIRAAYLSGDTLKERPYLARQSLDTVRKT